MDNEAVTVRDQMKRRAAEAAVAYVLDQSIIGVGSGSTVAYFIAALGRATGSALPGADAGRDGAAGRAAGMVPRRLRLRGAVPASRASAKLLVQYAIAVVDLNDVRSLPVYVDGADWVDPGLRLIKGAGAAMTGERLVAAASDRFVCIVDETKLTDSLRGLSIPLEVLPQARALVAREVARLGGRAHVRAGVTTDNGNPILDCVGLATEQPELLEQALKALPGVVGHGLFARHGADVLIVGHGDGVEERHLPSRGAT
jgi:ribose 5-phosphate isomerase A